MTPPSTSLTERGAELTTSRVPYVHARVVLAERPTSAKPGDEAIVLADGTIEGFVGGSCAEATVREQSLASLERGESALLRITPEPEEDQPGKTVVHNACLSGGTLEIFLEPHVPSPLVAVVGDAPIAQALRSLGEHLGFELRDADEGLSPDTTAVVVATHGRGEEAVLEQALRAGIGYVGLVASPKRGGAVVASLEVDDELRTRVHTPAGLDIGARTPAEVALSILAEIVAERPRPPSPAAAVPQAPALLPMAEVSTATDPVCGMAVEMVETSLHLDHHGQRVWFCGSGCKRAFAADPAAYGG
jgi:xanthine dehydrogenase accessory factor